MLSVRVRLLKPGVTWALGMGCGVLPSMLALTATEPLEPPRVTSSVTCFGPVGRPLMVQVSVQGWPSTMRRTSASELDVTSNVHPVSSRDASSSALSGVQMPDAIADIGDGRPCHSTASPRRPTGFQ